MEILSKLASYSFYFVIIISICLLLYFLYYRLKIDPLTLENRRKGSGLCTDCGGTDKRIQSIIIETRIRSEIAKILSEHDKCSACGEYISKDGELRISQSFE